MRPCQGRDAGSIPASRFMKLQRFRWYASKDKRYTKKLYKKHDEFSEVIIQDNSVIFVNAKCNRLILNGIQPPIKREDGTHAFGYFDIYKTKGQFLAAQEYWIWSE